MIEPFSLIPPFNANAVVRSLGKLPEVHRTRKGIPGHGASIGNHQRTVGRSQRSLIGELVPVQYDVRTRAGYRSALRPQLG